MIYKKLKQYAPERIGFGWAGMLLALLSATLTISAYYYLYLFLEDLLSVKKLFLTVPLALHMVLLLTASLFLYFASLIATHILAFRLETNLKKQGLRHLMRASFSFYDRNESGRIRKIIDDNTALTHVSVAHLIPDLTTALFTPLLGIPLCFYIDYRLGLLFTVSLFSGIFFIHRMMGEQSFMEAYMKASEKMNSGAVEYVRGIQVMKIFRTNVRAMKDFYQSIVAYSDLALKYSMSCRGWYVLFQLFFNSVFLVALFFGYMNAAEPRLYLTKFMFYVLFGGLLFIALMKVMYVGMYVFQASSSIKNIETLFTEMTERRLSAGELETMDSPDIEFRDVSFGYDSEPIIEKLSLFLPAGRSYALVGGSGSGKSTFAKLISGFYCLDSGQILVGGHALSEYSERALSRNIANVFQDAKLFKRSIYENVLLGRRSANREEVMKALHLAQCDEILDKFKDRENTLIGAEGVHLSGGEVQRIAIARAILKDAKIIILDEASAAADPENEYELQRALSNLMRGKTVIMIAHRLSSIKNVDEILVMKQGQVIERGSHKELMQLDSVYKRMQEMFMRANEWGVK
ncbi:ATP-binding cassette subfamily B protein [Fusobacterium naviforme]|nr:ABC transporter ATP-binding protein [Fusobacterium naviforme]PSL10750.1 ATP-binding cassette subfamily B protein [Fusobacterium naviforme]STO27300.1 Lipid A export ATP-binding/permease protein MsbA [Fusobacterium naviforme]